MVLLSLTAWTAAGVAVQGQAQPERTFRLWVTSDAHVDADKAFGRLSLADAITDAEEGGDQGGPAFEWDVMLHLGDLLAGVPGDEQGREVQRQVAASKKHAPEDFYFLLGNHDATDGQWWFRKWIDPAAEQPEVSKVRRDRRPYPVSGTWERYSFQVGNLLFLMMGDRNDGPPPAGRGASGHGYPTGRVSEETFAWWREMVASHPDKIIVSAHHHVLEGTTVASGLNEGPEGLYHGYVEDGASEGASFLYFVGETPHARKFESYLQQRPGAVSLWLGGHTHTNPDDTYGGRSHVERRWGTTFVNVAALTRFHALKRSPMSRLFTFVDGSDTVNVRCYLHTDDYEPEGWYAPAERNLRLGKPFRHPRTRP